VKKKNKNKKNKKKRNKKKNLQAAAGETDANGD